MFRYDIVFFFFFNSEKLAEFIDLPVFTAFIAFKFNRKR